MANKITIQAPPTGGGLFRPSDGATKGFQIQPMHVVVGTVAVILFEIALHFY